MFGVKPGGMGWGIGLTRAEQLQQCCSHSSPGAVDLAVLSGGDGSIGGDGGRGWGCRPTVGRDFLARSRRRMGSPRGVDGSGQPWYGLFPQEWLDGGEDSAGGEEQAGGARERRRKQLQRLGDCCLRLCADMWTMAGFLWITADRPTPKKDKSKRGRAWARKAAELLAANKVQLEKDISIYRMS